MTKVSISEDDDVVEALGFDAPYPPLGEGIQVGRHGRKLDRVDAGPAQDLPEAIGEDRHPIVEHLPRVAEKATSGEPQARSLDA